MRLSFPCPHCKQPLTSKSALAGRMIVCQNCLVASPVPQEVQPSPPEANSASQERDVSIRLEKDPGWELVNLGLRIVHLSMVALLAAIPIAGAAMVFFQGPLQLLVFFAALGVLACAYLGMCLCYNVPPGSLMRKRIRVAIVSYLLAALSCGVGLAINGSSMVPSAFEISLIFAVFAFISTVIGMVSWLEFLRAMARHFLNEELAMKMSDLLAVSLLSAFFLQPCSCIAVGIFSKNESHLMILSVLPFVALQIWHLVLLTRLRRLHK